MRIVTIDLEHQRIPKVPVCACIGYFDGLHIGHQKLIAQTRAAAQEYHCESALITFDPDPWVTVKNLKPNDVEHITTMRQKINLAVGCGIDNIYILNFTKQMADLSPRDFVEQVLGQMNLKKIICGFDFHYGAMGKGNCTTLKEQGRFEVEVVEEVAYDGSKISSTRICKLIENGEMEKANVLLGHPFEMEGLIVEGRHMGKEFGFPTANLKVSEEYLCPRPGVYACYALLRGQKYHAMCNLGHNPTCNYTSHLSLEVHILDFDEQIYGCRMAVQLMHFMRDEICFQNKNNLILQLELDANNTEKLLNEDDSRI